MNYSRALGADFVGLLESGGLLGELLPLIKRSAGDDPFALDLQFRGRHGLSIYHGWRVLVSLKLDPRQRTITLRYNREFDRDYLIVPLRRAGDLLPILESFLPDALTTCRADAYRNRQKGYWLNRLSLSLGAEWRPDQYLLIVDRDVSLDVTLPQLTELIDPLRKTLEEVPGNPQTTRCTFGHEGRCDLLGIGPHGHAYCIEVVHADDEAGVSSSVFEAALAAEVLRRAGAIAQEGLQLLVQQKVALGLLPSDGNRRISALKSLQTIPALLILGSNDSLPSFSWLEELRTRAPSLSRLEVMTTCGYSVNKCVP